MTVLTRSTGSLKELPWGVGAVQVDYDSQQSLVDALRGQEVLVACLQMDVIATVQPGLLDAAIKAGVRRYIPSEYSGITLDPGSRQMPLLTPFVEMQELIKQKAAEGFIEYTIIAPGGFSNVFIDLLLDWTNHNATFYDGGNKQVSVARLITIARGVAAVLKDVDKYKNAVVKFHDGTTSQKRCLEIAQRVDPNVNWTVENLDAQETMKVGLKALANGASFESQPVLRLMAANALAKAHHFGWTADEDESRVLGLDVLGQEGVDALVEKRARGELKVQE